MRKIHLAERLHDKLRWCVELLDRFTDQGNYAMSGCSVLAARWDYRFSADVDLYFAQTHLGVPLNDIKEYVTELSEKGKVGGLGEV